MWDNFVFEGKTKFWPTFHKCSCIIGPVVRVLSIGGLDKLSSQSIKPFIMSVRHPLSRTQIQLQSKTMFAQCVECTQLLTCQNDISFTDDSDGNGFFCGGDGGPIKKPSK